MPGAGKSVLGLELSNLLGIPFYDLDEGIEHEAGMSIPEIFESKGEKYFRTMESKLLRKIPEMTAHFVLSTGGGAPCFFDNMGFMNEEGNSIFLEVPLDVIAGRLMENGLDDRPLLKGKSREELINYLEEQYEKRVSHYSKAEAVVSGDDLKAEELLTEIRKRGWV